LCISSFLIMLVVFFKKFRNYLNDDKRKVETLVLPKNYSAL
jgi:hypothetical protein